MGVIGMSNSPIIFVCHLRTRFTQSHQLQNRWKAGRCPYHSLHYIPWIFYIPISNYFNTGVFLNALDPKPWKHKRAVFHLLESLDRKGNPIAGMLPGVECARRRRFYQGDVYSDDTQRRACYLSLYEPFSDRRSSSSQTTRPITLYKTDQNDNDKLHGVALEARERLEGRLRASSTVNKRFNHFMVTNNRDRGLITPSELVREGVQPAFGSTSKACIALLRKEMYTPETKRGKSWLKLKSRALEEEDCAVCLDCFKLNQILIHLPCGHKFHSSCLIPWLDNNQHCPYCRAKISP